MQQNQYDTAKDARFLRGLVTVVAVLLVGGFVAQLAAGRSSFSAPLIVHVHAVAFMGWVGIVLAQFWLAASGSLALHRRLGWLAAVYSLALLVLGTLVTVAAVQNGRTPFFFQPQHFLLADPATLLAFFALFATAIVLRKQTDWHARLHIGALIAITGPGVGRLLPLPLLIPNAFEIAAAIPLVFLLVGIGRDLRAYGRVHPAWLVGLVVIVGAVAAARVLADTPFGAMIFDAVAAGTPLAGADGLAYPPPPGPPPMQP